VRLVPQLQILSHLVLRLAAVVQTFVVALVNVSALHETGWLAQKLLEVVEKVEAELSTSVISVTTDAAASCRKARRIVQKERPSILGFDCNAHQVQYAAHYVLPLHCQVSAATAVPLLTVQHLELQVNLVVGDYMKGATEVKAASQTAVQIMRWFADHSIPHSMLQDAIADDLGRRCALIFPVVTRWNSYFDALTRFDKANLLMTSATMSERQRFTRLIPVHVSMLLMF
jgi:hypothetical protein